MFAWLLKAGEALTSLACLMSVTMSATRSLSRGPLRLPVIGQRGLLCKERDETLARGSSKSPCRAVRLVNFPRDRVSATGSDAFPPFFLARCCLGQVPGGAPFSQRSEQATACTNRMQIRN